jgi:putative hydrolase of the HAD superfamily
MTVQAPGAIVLDLGNVVFDIDFKRVFESWAATSGTSAQDLAAAWSTDEFYNQHEVGAITFKEYADALAQQMNINMTYDAWLDGWNALFVGPYRQVCDLLPQLADRLPLYAFTNTNPTHQAAWQKLYHQELSAFERVFISSEMGLRKPDPAAFGHICSTISTAPEDVLFIDDSMPNVEGAQLAGLAARHIHCEADVVDLLKVYL